MKWCNLIGLSKTFKHHVKYDMKLHEKKVNLLQRNSYSKSNILDDVEKY